MGRGTSVKQKEYEYIKEQLQKGKTAQKIAKMLFRSPDTIRTVNYSHDYEDFVKTPTKELRKRRKNLKGEQTKLNFDAVCEPESQPEKQEHDPDRTPEHAADSPVSELSAKDKKELAMYAIDQHYFFLKQLTGVI
jgi:hypothetical protein